MKIQLGKVMMMKSKPSSFSFNREIRVFLKLHISLRGEALVIDTNIRSGAIKNDIKLRNKSCVLGRCFHSDIAYNVVHAFVLNFEVCVIGHYTRIVVGRNIESDIIHSSIIRKDAKIAVLYRKGEIRDRIDVNSVRSNLISPESPSEIEVLVVVEIQIVRYEKEDKHQQKEESPYHGAACSLWRDFDK